MNKILFVEDDANLGLLLKENLDNKGFNVAWYKNGEDGFSAFKRDTFSLCILDVMLPLKDGFSLSKEIRAVNKEVPIIFLTARGQHEDRIKGFETGADDYVTKPFNTQELCMRINAILRRTGNSIMGSEKIINIAGVEFDYTKMQMSVGGDVKKLSSKEADLLRILIHHKNTLVPRKLMLETVWGNDDYFSAKSMDVYMSKIRKLLRGCEGIEILNAYGLGFKMIINE